MSQAGVWKPDGLACVCTPRDKEESPHDLALFPVIWPPDPDTCLNVKAAAYHCFAAITRRASLYSPAPPPLLPLLLFVFSSAQWAHGKKQREKNDRVEVRTGQFCQGERLTIRLGKSIRGAQRLYLLTNLFTLMSPRFHFNDTPLYIK